MVWTIPSHGWFILVLPTLYILFCFFFIAHIGKPVGKCCEGYRSSFNQLKGRRIVFGNDRNMCHAWKMLEDLKELGCLTLVYLNHWLVHSSQPKDNSSPCLSVFRAAEWKQETHTWNISETPTNITFQVLCRKTHLFPNSKLQSPQALQRKKWALWTWHSMSDP